jgi:hypothetical protein
MEGEGRAKGSREDRRGREGREWGGTEANLVLAYARVDLDLDRCKFKKATVTFALIWEEGDSPPKPHLFPRHHVRIFFPLT